MILLRFHYPFADRRKLLNLLRNDQIDPRIDPQINYLCQENVKPDNPGLTCTIAGFTYLADRLNLKPKASNIKHLHRLVLTRR